jgi:hypothetical protein
MIIINEIDFYLEISTLLFFLSYMRLKRNIGKNLRPYNKTHIAMPIQFALPVLLCSYAFICTLC